VDAEQRQHHTATSYSDDELWQNRVISTLAATEAVAIAVISV